MKRREFIEATALMSMGLGLSSFKSKIKTHIISFSFDDGFKKSFYQAAEVHEEYGLSACLNVIAKGQTVKDDFIQRSPIGDMEDWNILKSRGHEVMPHTWKHKNLTKIPLKKAKKNIDKCLDYFEEHLEGYDPSSAIYNYAYNASNDALDKHVLQRVRAVRTGFWIAFDKEKFHELPLQGSHKFRLGCMMHGPGNCDEYLEKEINEFLASQGGWMIFNLHGFDDEGWGPVSTKYYDRLLKRLVQVKTLDVLPVGEVMSP